MFFSEDWLFHSFPINSTEVFWCKVTVCFHLHNCRSVFGALGKVYCTLRLPCLELTSYLFVMNIFFFFLRWLWRYFGSFRICWAYTTWFHKASDKQFGEVWENHLKDRKERIRLCYFSNSEHNHEVIFCIDSHRR